VLMHGFALDERGRKMSKSLGNVVEPQEIIEKYGADVLRFYMISANPPWEDLKFNWNGVETVNKMLNILWNVHVFVTTYMSLDDFDPNKINLDLVRANFLPEDLWMISRTNSITREVTKALEEFDLHRASRAILNFIIEDLSRWYVRLVRERVWIEKNDPRKLAAYVALYQALHVLVRLLAPFMPHLSEVIYRDIVKSVSPAAPESVHMLPWPSVDEKAIDATLEQGMSVVRGFVEAGAAARQQAKLKLRWPVRRAVIQTSNELKACLKPLGRLLMSQLNCKELELIGPDEDLDKKILEGFVLMQTEFGKLAIDTEITMELKAECFAREIVRRLQIMRKEMDLGMEERVDVDIGVKSREELDLLATQQNYISREVRVRNLRICGFEEVRGEGYLKDWNIDGDSFRLLVKRLSA